MRLSACLILIIVLNAYCLATQQSSNPETQVADSQNWPETQKGENFKGENEEDEAIRRPRGKRRRRLRKRQRVHQEEEGFDQNAESSYIERISPEEEEEPTQTEIPRRRPLKRRRRPYRKHQDDGESKPPRRRRKGGRKRIRVEGIEEVQTELTPTEIAPSENYFDPTLPPSKPIAQNTIVDPLHEKSEIKEDYTVTLEHQSSEKNINEQENEQVSLNNLKREQEGRSNLDKPNGFGNKIFDRRRLFSNSRRLPVTSAIIRKLNTKVAPNTTEEQDNSNQNNESSGFNVLKAENSQQQNKISTENETTKKRLEENVEEANYPKIFFPRPFLKLQNKTKETKTLQSTTNEAVSSTEKESEGKNDVSLEVMKEFGMKIEDIEKTTDSDEIKPSSEDMNVTNDYIVELMKTQNGKQYLTNILETRNMTLEQLLDHRERGSSQFHLSEIFTPKQTTTTPTSSPSTSELPDLEVVDSSSINEEHSQKKDDSLAVREGRESKVLESMSQYSTETTSAKIENVPQPTWRVIPNPKLRPVSVSGNFEEIPVAKLPSSLNEIYLLDDKESMIIRHRKSDESFRDVFGGAFRRIPVGVKSAIIISGVILIVAIFGFLSLLISCRIKQKRSMLRRAKKDMMCEHLSTDEFMTSQQSLSPVLTKSQQNYPHQHQHNIPHHHPNHRHYYLWRTLRKTFRYD